MVFLSFFAALQRELIGCQELARGSHFSVPFGYHDLLLL
jgi:hypothetical protein